ncbi:MAG: V-type ATP synthase subunit D [Magnetococcales bacterium]|nr:V-type ATP synthase subunit D [Magnetococcales bacterium]
MEIVPTRSAFLELREERHVMQEGFQFLDEKRLLLAAELIRQGEFHRQVKGRWEEAWRHAQATLREAVGRHGLAELGAYPAAAAAVRIQRRTREFFGVRLCQATMEVQSVGPAPAPLNPTPEARRCAEAFGALLPLSVELSAVEGNLRRLLAEYRRTERRARALEDVILPEVEETLTLIGSALEELDQEEAVRVRLKRG